MKRTSYKSLFSVLVPRQRKDMFFMNMRVYDIKPAVMPLKHEGAPVSVVWCAVYRNAANPGRTVDE